MWRDRLYNHVQRQSRVISNTFVVRIESDVLLYVLFVFLCESVLEVLAADETTVYARRVMIQQLARMEHIHLESGEFFVTESCRNWKHGELNLRR